MSDLAAGHAVAAGDFNDSGHDDPPARWADLPGFKQVRHTLPEAPGVEDTEAARVLHTAGFQDIGTALGDRRPTAGFGDGSIAIRCDRILLSPSLTGAATRYQVIDTDGDSDHHHLVVADLNLARVQELTS